MGAPRSGDPRQQYPRLDCLSDNLRLCGYYEDLGFRRVGFRMVPRIVRIPLRTVVGVQRCMSDPSQSPEGMPNIAGSVARIAHSGAWTSSPTALSFPAKLLGRLLFKLSSFKSAVAAHGLRR
jgi:hypothetical protein